MHRCTFCLHQTQTRELRRQGTEWVRQQEWVSEFWKGSVIWEQNFPCSTTCRQHVSFCVLVQCFVPWLVFVLRNNFHLSSGSPTCCSSSFSFFYSVTSKLISQIGYRESSMLLVCFLRGQLLFFLCTVGKERIIGLYRRPRLQWHPWEQAKVSL